MKCPNCNKEIENKTETCPHCGANLSSVNKDKCSIDFDLQQLISFALVDGKITDKERKVLSNKVKKMGGDPDEFELYLDAELYKMQHQTKDNNLNNEIDSEVKICSNCGAVLNDNAKFCKYCGTKFDD